jgi:hypothetical protein
MHSWTHKWEDKQWLISDSEICHRKYARDEERLGNTRSGVSFKADSHALISSFNRGCSFLIYQSSKT